MEVDKEKFGDYVDLKTDCNHAVRVMCAISQAEFYEMADAVAVGNSLISLCGKGLGSIGDGLLVCCTNGMYRFITTSLSAEFSADTVKEIALLSPDSSYFWVNRHTGLVISL